MANKTRAQLSVDSSTNFPDNTSQLISPADLRDWITNGIDSFVTQKDISSLQNAIYENRSDAIVAGATTDLSIANGNFVHITGTTLITSFGSLQKGARFIITFDDAANIQASANLIIPGVSSGSTKTAVPGDCCILVSEDGGAWRIVGYFPAAGAGSGLVVDVTATAPISSTGGTTPDISIPQADSSTDGYLSQGDWTNFDGKVSASGTPSAGEFAQFTSSNDITTATASTSKLLIGTNDSSNVVTEISLGTNLTMSGSTLNATGGTGTVQSVSGTGSVQGLTLSGTVTGTGNLTLSGSLSAVNLASQVTGLLPVANGGTGTATPTLSAGTGIGITGTWPNQTITASGSTSTSTVQHQVKLGENINKGQAVYVSSANGTNMIVSKASNTTEATSSKTMGLIDATGVTNDFVNVITEGLLSGLDTSAANAAGDPVWLGSSGNLLYGLANKPYAPLHLVFIGIVTRKNASNGEIFVKVQNGFELDELHNVQATSPTLNDTLYYDNSSSPGQWKTAQVTAITPLASSSDTGLISASAQTLGGIKTFGNGASAGEIRLLEGSGSGSNYVAVKSPATLGANLDFVLPSTAGTSGYVLQTDGSGNLSYVRNGGTINGSYILDTTETTATGTSELINKTLLIPANTFSSQTAFKITVRTRKDNAGFNVVNIKLYLNTTSSTISGAFSLGGVTFAASGSTTGLNIERGLVIISSTQTSYNLVTNNSNDFASGTITLSNIDWTVNQHVIVTTQCNNAAYSAFVRAIQIIPQ